MARYRKIDPRIHNDSKFCSLSLEGRYLFMFVLTHPNMTSLGAFRTTKESLISELKGLGEGFAKGFMKGFDELCEKGLLKYDEKGCMLFATHFIKYNPPENPNVVKGWLGALDLLPECPLLVEVLKNASDVANSLFSNGKKAFENPLESIIQTLSKEFREPFAKGLAKSMPIQEQEQEQEYISSTVVNTPVEDSTPWAKKPSAGVKAQTFKLDVEELPDEWRQYCNAARPDLNPDKVFVNFKAYWTIGKGKGKLRSEKGWTQSWMTWCTKESERPTTSNMNLFASKGPKEPEQDFSLVDYGAAGAF